MINGAHVIIYSTDADADRAFFRDVLGLSHVDVGDGWLIFGLPPSEVAVHPTEMGGGGGSGGNGHGMAEDDEEEHDEMEAEAEAEGESEGEEDLGLGGGEEDEGTMPADEDELAEGEELEDESELEGGAPAGGRHELWLMCDDIEDFVSKVGERDLACSPVQDQGWGIVTQMTLPGGGRLGVYQPRHARPPSVETPAGGGARARKPPAAKKPARKVAKPAAKAVAKAAAKKPAPKAKGKAAAAAKKPAKKRR